MKLNFEETAGLIDEHREWFDETSGKLAEKLLQDSTVNERIKELVVDAVGNDKWAGDVDPLVYFSSSAGLAGLFRCLLVNGIEEAAQRSELDLPNMSGC